MFTGLVEARGKLAGRSPRGPGARLVVHGPLDGLVLGESIAVDGVCLTVEAIVPGGFEADASAETLARSTLGALPLGAGVNLERAMVLGGRMGGHIVGGHVDAVGTLLSKRPVGDAVEVTFAIPRELSPLVAPKGSVCVNGVSLTVNGAGDGRFDVVLIPATQRATGLHEPPVGAKVNIEVDVLARYVARQLAAAPSASGSPSEGGPAGDADATWMARLGRAGYL